MLFGRRGGVKLMLAQSMSRRFWKIQLFPLCQCIVTLVKGHRFLWGTIGKNIKSKVLGILAMSFLEYRFPFIQKFLGL